MLIARKRGVFKREYDVVAGDQPVTELGRGRRESSEFVLAGVGYRIERDGRKRFALTGPEGRVASAEQETGRSWSIKAATGNVKLVRPSIWRSRWELHQRGSAQGTIHGNGAFSRSYTADLPADVPLPVQVFAFYVVLVVFERAAAAAAAGSS